MTMVGRQSALAAGLVGLVLVGLVGGAGIGGASTASTDASAAVTTQDDSSANVSEEAYVEPAPEPGDPYYEASDGNWVSYDNPRDEYRSPYLGDGSGKIGVTLLNEAGEPIVGETVPNTTIVIPTGETTSWHSHADPVTVDLPLTEHYERPLDSDQFGTTDDLPQGNGYMDTHSIEMHGHPEDATIEYGQARVEGEHADKIEVVGYIQQAHDTWETDIDPLEAAEPYEEAGGGWTYHPGGSHGQVIVVLQLDEDVTEPGPTVSSNAIDDPGDGSEENDTQENTVDATTSDESDESDNDEMPGFGGTAVLVALALVAIVGARRQAT